MQKGYIKPEICLISFDNITIGICQNGNGAPHPACVGGQSAEGVGGCGQGNVADDRCVAGVGAGAFCKSGTGFE